MTRRGEVRPLAAPRTEVLGTRGAVASSSPLVSRIGAQVLADGGNAVDASLAMAAASWMVLPGQCGIGGDAFAVVREPDGRVWTVGGSGTGPDGGTLDFYRERGHTAVPLSGALAVAVPGALAAVRRLHADGATRSLADLWAPAVRLARDGVPCTRKTRADIAEHAASLARDEGAARMFLPGGDLPALGQPLGFEELGAFVAAAAEDTTDDFYRGTFAERAVTALREGGAPFSGEEWAAGARVAAAPAIVRRYGDVVLHQTPPPTPGWMVLQAAAICDGVLASRELLDAEAVHWMAEAFRQAFRDRYDSCGSDTEEWRATLAGPAVARVRDQIGAHRASRSGPARTEGDTTSTVCVDADGRAVSFIHSLAFTFGARAWC